MYLDALFTGAFTPATDVAEGDEGLGVPAHLAAGEGGAAAQRPLFVRRARQRYTEEYSLEDEAYGLEAA